MDAAAVVHSLLGSVPAAIGPHVPFVPVPRSAALHATQMPLHAVLQQNPSMQLPDEHCAARVHAAPFVSSAVHAAGDADVLQKYPVAHVASVVHADGQLCDVPLQSRLTSVQAGLAELPARTAPHVPSP